MAGIVAGIVAVMIATGGGGSTPARRYGGLPNWLPRSTVQVGRLVTASRAQPRLAIEGDTVRVDLDRGRVLATVVGPDVPEEGGFPVPKTSPCRFTVTLTQSSGDVPLRAAAFTILGENRHLYHPRVRLAGSGRLPARVVAGRTMVLIVSDVLPTGAGQLRWSPLGGKPISVWDFDVEID